MDQKRELLKQFDKDGDGRLNTEERKAARAFLAANPGRGGFGGRRGPRGGPGGPGGREARDPAKPGPRISPAETKAYPNAGLYEPTVLRTIFIDFEDADWEAEMADFYRSDVTVPATLTVDGKKYPNVGVAYRGNTSYMMAGQGYKKSLKLSLDDADSRQRLYGYKTLDLLNGAEDPSFLHTILYYDIARQYTPAMKANLVKVVINGESWGLYVNTQSFDKEFAKDWFTPSKGTRWKVPVNFRGDSGLAYLGDNIDDYKRKYEMKNGGSDKDWKALISLCKTLKETPNDKLEEALRPIFDVDHALWYMAVDNVLVNGDGLWTRCSDYGLFRDSKGVFHMVPHDVNETFKAGGGPGGPGGPGGFGPPPAGFAAAGPADPGGPADAGGFGGRRGRGGFGGMGGPGGGFGRGGRGGGPGGPGGGVTLDPLAGANDANKAILNRLLAVPSLRQRYLQHVRTIAEQQLDWSKLGPRVAAYRALMEKEVEADTRKLYTLAAFRSAVGDEIAPAPQPAQPAQAGRGGEMSLRDFARQRSAYLLGLADVQKAGLASNQVK
jgi:hypothetical protein